jgi:hypothetical protein
MHAAQEGLVRPIQVASELSAAPLPRIILAGQKVIASVWCRSRLGRLSVVE